MGGVGKKKLVNQNLDVRNNLARSHTEHRWRCSLVRYERAKK